MPNLLLQSCSASKNDVNHPTQAFDLYSGYFYMILKKSMRENEFRSDTDLCILSAKYGILEPTDEIEFYDKQMDAARARELNASVVEALSERVSANSYDRIIVNMGTTYRKAIEGLNDNVDANIEAITGGGIGEKGNALYRFIRGDDSVLDGELHV